MTSMIEIVAAACRAAAAEDRGRSVSFEEMSFIVARAAIEAMREPPDELMLAAVEAVHKFAVGHDVEFYRYHGAWAPDAQRVYQERLAVGFGALLDAALSEDAR